MMDINCFSCGNAIAAAEDFDGEKEAMLNHVARNSVEWSFYRGEDGWESETVCLHCESVHQSRQERSSASRHF